MVYQNKVDRDALEAFRFKAYLMLGCTSVDYKSNKTSFSGPNEDFARDNVLALRADVYRRSAGLSKT